MRPSEWLALAPLAAVTIIYWVRDRYRFNRALGGVTRAQWRVLLLANPPWLLMYWTLSLQINRGHVVPALVTTAGQYVAAYLAVVGMLNDNFHLSRQQVTAFAIGLVIQYIWTVFYLLTFRSHEGEEVHHVVGANGSCECNA